MENLATGDSLNESMGSAIKHYSSLFFLPSFTKTLAALVRVWIEGWALSTAFLLPTFEGLLYGLLLGVSSFAFTFLCDYLVTNVILRKDAIFVIRRTAALSLFCWILWLVFIVPGVLLGFWLWVKLCLLGFAAVMTLRAVVFFSTSTAGLTRGGAASMLSPFFLMIPFLIYWTVINGVS